MGRESFCLSIHPGVRDAVVDVWTLACPAEHPSAHGSWTAAERWVRSRESGWGRLKVPAPFTGCRVPSRRGARRVSSSCLLTGRRGASDTSRIVGGGLSACQPLPTLPHLSPPGFPLRERTIRRGTEPGQGDHVPECLRAAGGAAHAPCKEASGEIQGWCPGEVAPLGPPTLMGLCPLSPRRCRGRAGCSRQQDALAATAMPHSVMRDQRSTHIPPTP